MGGREEAWLVQSTGVHDEGDTMRRLSLYIALSVIVAFSTQTLAQEIVWAKDYPKAGTLLNGGIAVKGSVTPKPGWSVPQDKNGQRWASAVFWISGKNMKSAPIKVDANLTFETEFSDATIDRTATYNVVMVVTLQKQGEKDRDVGSAPGATKPK
jgi:hypothetical protein